MSRRRRDRGAALAWAILFSCVVLIAVSAAAGALSRQAEAVRRLQEQGAREDLLRAGRAWARAGRGGVLELDGGSVELRRSGKGPAELVITLRGRSAEAPRPLRRRPAQ